MRRTIDNYYGTDVLEAERFAMQSRYWSQL
jgi:hypothetical protein